MTARERMIKTLDHEDPGDVVVDLGSSLTSGISAIALSRLKKALDLPGSVRVFEPVQMLGEVEEDIRRALGIDVVGISDDYTAFGYRNKDWKPWRLFDGTDVQVGGDFSFSMRTDGALYVHPHTDTRNAPSAKMPKDGLYFDMLIRQQPLERQRLDPREDYVEDFVVMSDEKLQTIQRVCDYYYKNTDYALNGGNFLTSFGDLSPLPGPNIVDPKGIRDPAEWLVAFYTMPNYIKEVFHFQS
jgi:hypothetical protein